MTFLKESRKKINMIHCLITLLIIVAVILLYIQHRLLKKEMREFATDLDEIEEEIYKPSKYAASWGHIGVPGMVVGSREKPKKEYTR